MIIEAGLTRYEAVNKEIEKQLEKQNKVTVKDVNGQRYIGCALDEGKTIEVYGTPGTLWVTVCVTAKFIFVITLLAVAVFI